MAEEKLSIDNLEELSVEELTEETTPKEEPKEEPKAEEEPSDFLDAINKAMEDEPEPEAEKEPEAEPEPEPEAEEALSPSAKNFKKIKDDRDNARKEVEQLKAKLGEGNNADKLEKVQQERDELSEQLKLTAIERHPEFKRRFEERATKLIATAKSMVGVGQDEKIVQVMFMAEGDERTEQLDDLFAELPVSKQARLANIIQDMDTLQEERVEALNNANATMESLSETDRQNQAGYHQGQEQLFDEIANAKAPNIGGFYVTKEDDEEWNTGVQERVDLARRIYTGATTAEELVLASLWAAQAPDQRKALYAQVEVNRRLKAQIKELTGATPSVTADADDSKEGKEKGFLDTLHGLMEEQ